MSSIESASGTSFSAICVVMGTTRNEGPTSIMTALDLATPQRSAMNRSEEHTSELQSLMRISYAVFCLKKTTTTHTGTSTTISIDKPYPKHNTPTTLTNQPT